jgi:hypothetical protein
MTLSVSLPPRRAAAFGLLCGLMASSCTLATALRTSTARVVGYVT